MNQLQNLLLVFVIALSSLIIHSVESQGQGFEGLCDNVNVCDTKKFLKCSNSTCVCEDPETQVFDEVENHCVIQAGGNCSLENGTPSCLQGAECDPSTKQCKCLKSFYETEWNICSYTIGKPCTGNPDCDASEGLVCLDEVCKCPNSTYIWQLELGCVTLEQIMELSGGNETTPFGISTAVFPTGLNETTNEINETSTSSTPGPFGFGISLPNYTMPLDNSSIIEDMEFEEELAAGNEANELGLGDRSQQRPAGLLGPIINLLTPGIRRPVDNAFPVPNFQSQNGNPNVLPDYQRPNQNQFDPNAQNQLNQINPNNQNNQIYQNNQNNQNFQNQQIPNNQVIGQNIPQNQQSSYQPPRQQQQQTPNFQQPPKLPQPLQNTMNMRYPAIIRNIFNPWRRFLFPGIKDDPDFRLPSPVWLAVATINQILPVLRALDHQFSPWLQTLALLSKPKYIPLINADSQYQSSQRSQNQYQTPLYGNEQNQQQNNGVFPFLGRR